MDFLTLPYRLQRKEMLFFQRSLFLWFMEVVMLDKFSMIFIALACGLTVSLWLAWASFLLSTLH